SGPPRFEFPSPLAAPRDLPPPGALERVGTASARLRGCIDIGAFSYTPPPRATEAPPASPPAHRGCACAWQGVATSTSSRWPWAAALAALALLGRRLGGGVWGVSPHRGRRSRRS